MGHCRAALSLAGLLVLPALLAAQTKTPLNRAINSQVAAAKRQAAPLIGVHVVEAASGGEIYSFAADAPRVAASNTKLFTTAAALDRLGPGYFFETPVLWRGEIESGELRGDLAVVGGGDPNISGRWHQDDPLAIFEAWTRALRALGVEHIRGDLVLVDGLFDRQWVHPDWPRDQLTRWYEAPVSALSFNDNCVIVRVRPEGRPGTPAEVEILPPVDLYALRTSVSTVADRRRHGLRIDRLETPGEDHVYTVSGRIHQRAESVDKALTVSDPVAFFGAGLRQAMAAGGIRFAGEVRRRQAIDAEGWRTLLVHRSGLLDTLAVTNKRSQNFYAESLLKLLGARLCGSGTWQGGVRAVDEFLAEIGVPAGYRMADGSGMSRNNRFSPRQITHLLRHMLDHRWGAEFVRSLPYSGEHGLSWSRRLATAPYRGNVMAKTGTLNGVSTLSGYAKGRSGKLYVFSILCNQTRGSTRAKAAQDRIVRALIDHG